MGSFPKTSIDPHIVVRPYLRAEYQELHSRSQHLLLPRKSLLYNNIVLFSLRGFTSIIYHKGVT